MILLCIWSVVLCAPQADPTGDIVTRYETRRLIELEEPSQVPEKINLVRARLKEIRPMRGFGGKELQKCIDGIHKEGKCTFPENMKRMPLVTDVEALIRRCDGLDEMLEGRALTLPDGDTPERVREHVDWVRSRRRREYHPNTLRPPENDLEVLVENIRKQRRYVITLYNSCYSLKCALQDLYRDVAAAYRVEVEEGLVDRPETRSLKFIQSRGSTEPGATRVMRKIAEPVPQQIHAAISPSHRPFR